MVEGKAELKSKVKRLETQQALLEKYSNQLTAASHHANRQSLAQGETLGMNILQTFYKFFYIVLSADNWS